MRPGASGQPRAAEPAAATTVCFLTAPWWHGRPGTRQPRGSTCRRQQSSPSRSPAAPVRPERRRRTPAAPAATPAGPSARHSTAPCQGFAATVCRACRCSRARATVKATHPTVGGGVTRRSEHPLCNQLDGSLRRRSIVKGASRMQASSNSLAMQSHSCLARTGLHSRV